MMRLIIGMAAVTLATAPAGAARFDLVLTGTISDFGGSGRPAGVSVGDQASVRVTLDDTLGTFTDDGDQVRLVGGASIGSTSPGLDAQFTSGAFTYSLNPSSFTEVDFSANELEGQFIGDGTDLFSFRIASSDPVLPTSFASFSQALLNPGTATLRFVGQGSSGTIGLGISRISLGAASVPEPASWMMLVIGFGAIGAAARRRGVPAAA